MAIRLALNRSIGTRLLTGGTVCRRPLSQAAAVAAAAPPQPPAATLRGIEVDAAGIAVTFAADAVGGGDEASLFHSAWLWHNAPAHRHPTTGQIVAAVAASLGDPPRLAGATLGAAGGALTARWADGATATYPAAWLAAHRYDATAINRATTAALPRPLGHAVAASGAQPPPLPSSPRGRDAVPAFDYADVVSREEAVHAWLQALHAGGLALLTGAPDDAGAVLAAAARIAHRAQPTMYGDTWQVAVQHPAPVNIAYTAAPLALHQDLAYYESPPGVQLLHCRRFAAAVAGGESTFLDGLAAAAAFAQAQPGAFAVLARVPTTFQKVHYARAQPAHVVAHRPVFAVDAYRAAAEAAAAGPAAAPAWHRHVTGLFWAPQFEGPLRAAPGDVAAYYAAYAAWAAFLQAREATAALVEFRLREGDVIAFNNRRMLHGRHGFGPAAGAEAAAATEAAGTAGSGPLRLLQGCYVNVDDFNSRVHTLAQRFGGGALARVGNQNWL